MRGNNFKDLIKNEMVNRFENVILDEIALYKNSVKEITDALALCSEEISETKKSIQDVKNFVSSSCDSLESRFFEERSIMQNDVDSQRVYLKEKCNFINEQAKQLKNCMNEIVTIDEYDEKIASVMNSLERLQVSNLENNDRIEQKLVAFQEEVNRFVVASNSTLLQQINMLSDTVRSKQDVIDALISDHVFASKEIEHIKKTAFIQEKKIENLYTLIERLKGIK